MIKDSVTRALTRRLEKYLKKGEHQIIVVSGSIGKTSVTQAIATMLGTEKLVVSTKRNYNTPIGVCLSIFDEDSQTSALGWGMLFVRCFFKSLGKPNADVYVLELGTDGPGQLEEFAYLRPDIAVVTAATPEHMEFFHDIDAVAKEELSVVHFSKRVIVNTDLVPGKDIDNYLQNTPYLTYGKNTGYTANVQNGTLVINLGQTRIETNDFRLVGQGGISTLLAASTVASVVGLSADSIKKGISTIEAVPGRMSLLGGIKGSEIIDDTYNSSPDAAVSALDYLYSQVGATQRVALLGMMNELGDNSQQYHEQVGQYCDPQKLDLLVTLGAHANEYLAPAAEKNGCVVLRAETPVQAAKLIEANLQDGAVILAKGSQNGVYAEEAVKRLLRNPADANRLVRQHDYWPAKKAAQFPDLRDS